MAALATLAYAHYLGGDAALARSTADHALNRPEAAQRPHGVVYAHSVHSLLECDAGRFEVAEKEALHAVARARDLGISGTWSAGIARHALGETLLARGHARDAERELSRAVTLRRAGEPRLDTVHSLIQLARARVACGKLGAAASDLDVAEQLLSAFSDAGRLPDMAAEVARALDAVLPEAAASCRAAQPRRARGPPAHEHRHVCARDRTDSCAFQRIRSIRTFDESTPSWGRTPATKRSAHARRDGLIDVDAVAETPAGDRRRTTRHPDQPSGVTLTSDRPREETASINPESSAWSRTTPVDVVLPS